MIARSSFALVLAATLTITRLAHAQDVPAAEPVVPPTAPVRAEPSAAAPGTPEDEAASRARALFQEGVAFSRSERWAEALDRFRQSAALVERPSTLLNIATALQRLGRPRECVTAVDRYLAISDATADADARGRAAALREAMVATIAHVSLAILPAGAELSVDGNVVSLPEDGRIDLDPGAHAFLVQHPGHLPSRFTLDLGPGAIASRAITLATRPTDPALLEVSTQVVGGRIEVDGDVVGTDDVELELVPGPHVIRVTASGWEPFERTVVIEAGTRARIAAQLSRPGSCQSVECEPAFWIVGGLLLAGAAGATIGIVFATASEGEPYGGTADFHIDALSF